MKTNRKLSLLPQCMAAMVIGAAVTLAPQWAAGQSPGDTRGDNRHVSPPTAAYRYFTSSPHRDRKAATAQPLQSSAPHQGAVQQASATKPFQDIQHAPTLSPYLTLDYFESATSIPNYYAFTKPMVQQNQTNEAQAREIRKLRQQVRAGANGGSGLRSASRGLPTTGNSMQFQNLGTYYPSMR